jgi:BirA family biotin operon repressor/biotin-[acetyl-CoA-carboxylase] ligase
MKFNIIELEEVDSTNKYAKDNIEELNNFDVIFTKRQTSGRGRMGRVWEADNKSLAFSIVIKDSKLLNDFESLSIISAAAVFRALSTKCDKVSIKWPNDVYIGSKKVCGILSEGISYDKLVGIIDGIGINVNNSSLPLDTATSLFMETGKEYNIKDILFSVLNNFDDLITKHFNGNNEYLDIINENNYLFGKTAYAEINKQKKLVKIYNVLPNNHLVIEYDGNKKVISTGEISFHLND